MRKLGGARLADDKNRDLCAVWYFHHLPSPSLPKGRETVFLSASCVLSDGPLQGDCIPVHRLSADEKFDASDHRSRWNREQRQVWASATELFEKYRGKGETAAQFAIRFCLSFDAVSTVIPGMLTRAHVAENSAAGDTAALGAPDKSRIRDIYKSNRFFVGR